MSRNPVLRVALPLACLLSMAALPVVAAPPAGGWIFDGGPDFPGFTRVQVRKDQGKYTGTVTSHWYGDLKMDDVRVDGDTLVFHLFNGIRHLFFDAGYGFELKDSYRSCCIVFIVSLIATALSWVVGLLLI